MQIGDAAPDFELRDLNGETRHLHDLSGLIILNFWSCTCPHVSRTDELIEQWRDQHWGPRVVVVRIAPNVSESAAEIAQATGQGNSGLLLIDDKQVAADLYGAVTTPHVFVILDGRVRYSGAVDDAGLAKRVPTRFHLREAVDALLEGKEPPVPSTQPYGCAIIRQALE